MGTALLGSPLHQAGPTSLFLGVKPDWPNAAVSRDFALAMKSEPKKPGMVVCAYNSRAEEVEEGSYSRLLSVFLTNRSIQGGGVDSA